MALNATSTSEYREILISISFHRKPLWGESVEVKVWEQEENIVWERERDSSWNVLNDVFFSSKSASSKSYFGLKSLPALRDNGTVLSVVNTNYHYIYSCIRGFLCFSESSSRTSHETLRNLQRRTLHWLETQAKMDLQPTIRVQHVLFAIDHCNM